MFNVAVQQNLKEFSADRKTAFARANTNAAKRIVARGKLRLREDTRRGGLGDRIANAWQDKVFPKSGIAYSPAGLLFSKAPLIIRAFSAATTIRSKQGSYLAIPTENTPRRGRRHATPVEVEAIFNQDLIFFHGRGQQMLAFVDATKSKSGKGYRRATKRRTKDGRRAELVLMFVMVRQVHLTKRVNYQRIFADLEAEWPQVVAEELVIEFGS
jgi:hypothetical protein